MRERHGRFGIEEKKILGFGFKGSGETRCGMPFKITNIEFCIHLFNYSFERERV